MDSYIYLQSRLEVSARSLFEFPFCFSDLQIFYMVVAVFFFKWMKRFSINVPVVN